MEQETQQIRSGVYVRQIQLLYKNQAFALASTAIVLLILFLLLSVTTGWMKLLPWVAGFTLVLGARAVATWYFLRQDRDGNMNPVRAEYAYLAGVIPTACMWAYMIYTLFPALMTTEQTMILVMVFALVAASHITMGYRKSAYITYSTIILAATIYTVYMSDYPASHVIVLGLVAFGLFVFGASFSFYRSVEHMLRTEEQSIRQKHRLLMQREQASLESHAKTEFLSRMSHELRTPLNAVIGLNDLQMRDQEHPLSGSQRDRAAKISEASNHLLSLVNDVLDMSRIESDTFTVKPTAVDYVQLIAESLKLVEVRAEMMDIKLEFSPPQQPAWVVADRQRLKQVVVNLLDNAVKFNRRGGEVSVTLESCKDDYWRLAIRDTGPGIAHANMGALFKPFSRLDDTSSKTDGAGVGLSFSKQLVELMNGEIGVDSTPGEGSCFWVRLQATEPVSVASYGVPRQVEVNGSVAATAVIRRHGKLLLVEDNEVNQEVAHDMLQDMGFDVDVANNGEQALESIEQNEYAAVLMDCQMPVMDGITATREIRNRESGRDLDHLPVIALTAHALQGAREQCIASGMDDFLSKPFSYEELRTMLAKWVVLPSSNDPVSTPGATAAGDSIDRQAAHASVIDMVMLSRLRTRKTSLVGKVVERYLKDSPGMLEDIDASIDDGNYEQLSLLVHTFKSSSLTVGAIEVADSCRQIEAMCTTGDVQPAAVRHLHANYLTASDELRQVLQNGEYSATA